MKTTLKSAVLSLMTAAAIFSNAGHCPAGTVADPSQLTSMATPEEFDALTRAGFQYFRYQRTHDEAFRDAQAHVNRGGASEFRIIKHWMDGGEAFMIYMR